MTLRHFIHLHLATEQSYALLAMRVALGAVILPHGLQKAFGLFGGPGFEGAMGFLTTQIGLPWIIALLVILIETLGALTLILGFTARKSAFLIAVVLIGAIVTVHWKNGFFMQDGGFEYHLLGIGAALAIVIGGAGACSFDRWLATTCFKK